MSISSINNYASLQAWYQQTYASGAASTNTSTTDKSKGDSSALSDALSSSTGMDFASLVSANAKSSLISALANTSLASGSSSLFSSNSTFENLLTQQSIFETLAKSGSMADYAASMSNNSSTSKGESSDKTGNTSASSSLDRAYKNAISAYTENYSTSDTASLLKNLFSV